MSTSRPGAATASSAAASSQFFFPCGSNASFRSLSMLSNSKKRWRGDTFPAHRTYRRVIRVFRLAQVRYGKAVKAPRNLLQRFYQGQAQELPFGVRKNGGNGDVILRSA